MAESGTMAFDVQAHRGGMALTVENTLAAFAKALEIGVSTLEFDLQVTRDWQVVVAHDGDPNPITSLDTSPAFPGDPGFPYVRHDVHIKDLTLAQIRTIDTGSLRHPSFPEQVLAPGARMPLLSEVFGLVRAYGADDVRMNVEAKVEAATPERTAPREEFVRAVVREIREGGMLDRVTIESFDWGALIRTREVEPRLPIAALTNGQEFLQLGERGASPWLGGLDIDDFPGSLQERYVAAAASFGADAVSPVHGEPQDAPADDPDYVPFTTRELVDAAHDAGMRVVPWTIDHPSTVRRLIELGVDGVITNRPDMVRQVLAELGLELPPPYPARPGQPGSGLRSSRGAS
jgi:glycerophosphoryl diester phosphodiesterase